MTNKKTIEKEKPNISEKDNPKVAIVTESKPVPVAKETALPKVQDAANKIQLINIPQLLEKVMTMEKGAESLEMVSKLLELQEKQEAKIAKAEFNRAKAECQAALPQVKKTRGVNNKAGTKVIYRYASLDDARKECMPIISRYGFSDSWSQDNEQSGINIKYNVRHKLGHEESTSMFCPSERSEYMNNIQRSGSTNTYGKRYTFCNFWGIVLDEDDDGRGNSEPGKPKQGNNQKPNNKNPQDAINYLKNVLPKFKSEKDWVGLREKLNNKKGIWNSKEVWRFVDENYEAWKFNQENNTQQN